MRSGVSIPCISDWVRVHINKPGSHPLSLCVSEKYHNGVENGPKKERT